MKIELASPLKLLLFASNVIWLSFVSSYFTEHYIAVSLFAMFCIMFNQTWSKFD